MNILCVGDVVGDAGLAHFCRVMPELKRSTAADFVVVNGENSDKSGVGLSPTSADVLLQHADVLTGGNHSLNKMSMDRYEENERILMPANQPYATDEMGMCTVDIGRLGEISVISLAGVAFMEPLDNPFSRVDALLKKTRAKYIVVDFHAESTAEKKSLAYYLDGRVSVLFGTHTHVQTADEQVLPAGTGYLTDIGMTGPIHSVIGVQAELAVQKQSRHVPVRFKVADGPCQLNGALFTLDDATGRCTAVERFIV